jgi:predicted nucleic acid-binding protein
MQTKYLLDTNILIYYFNNQPEVQDVFDAIDTRKLGGLQPTMLN